MKELPAVLGGTPMLAQRVPISSSTLPAFNTVEASYRDIFSTGMITNFKYVEQFEDRMSRFLGVEHAVAVSSASSGLLLLLKCLGLEGQVILPSFTFSVTGHVLAWNGLEPRYADIDPNTCLIDPEAVEKAITPNTRAILGVHIWGNPCRADQLQAIADRHGLELIFDAAQAGGSRYLERPVGGFGHAEVFSCSPTKVITSGEGGLVATNDASLAEKLRVGRNYGDDGSYDCTFEGINARMSELHAILGLASLEMAETNIQRRHLLIEQYRERLGDIPGIRFQQTTPGGVTNGVYFSIMINEEEFGLSRDQLYQALKLENIETRRYYTPPLHRQKVYSRLTPLYENKLPHTDRVAACSLTLPMFSHLPEEQVGGICHAIGRLHQNRELVQGRWAQISGPLAPKQVTP